MIKKEHLVRWMRSSLYSWFTDQLKDKITVYIETTEHVDKNGKITTQLPTWAEMRMNGPEIKVITKSCNKYEIAMNFLIETQLTGKNLYTHDNSIGLVYAAYASSIGVFKLGKGVDDDNSPVGCFQLDTENSDPFVINHFGQLDPAVKLTQSTIEAHYYMYLDT